jgi:phosphate transport system permease protein
VSASPPGARASPAGRRSPVLRRSRTSARVVDAVMTTVIRAVALLLIALLAYLVAHLLWAGRSELNLRFLTTVPKAFEAGGGIAPQLFNSFYVLVLSLLITAPLGIAAGTYMAEYARPGRLLGLLRTATETLATLPSIVVGLFGLLIFVEATGWHFTRLGGALALTVINLPYVVRVTEDALRAVPDALREGSMGLGATRWQTVRGVLLPSAIPGLVTGLILASGRAFGEAAALLYTAGQSAPSRHFFNLNPFAGGETLAVHLYSFRIEANVPDAGAIADGSAAVLLLVVVLFNLLARGAGRLAVRRVGGR